VRRAVDVATGEREIGEGFDRGHGRHLVAASSLTSATAAPRSTAARTAQTGVVIARNPMHRRSASVITVSQGSVEPSTPRPPPLPLRVATFNLLHGRSMTHGGGDRGDLAQAAAAIDADVLGLQEVDRMQQRSGTIDQTAVVAAAMGARHWRFVPALDGTPGTSGSWSASSADDGAHTVGPTYGVGLASRLPALAWRVRRFGPAPVSLPLMVPGTRGLTQVPDEPRVALAAVLDGPCGPMTVITTHLSFVPGWNVAQLRALVRWSRALPGPTLIIGDLNLPGPLPQVVSRWNRLARVATYPSWRPRVQFDHVLAKGIEATAVRRVASLRMPVSDHCALVVDLDL
jgi:endonuclease/exonuclease/phosphatase family metal-dependent hydrolase